MDQSIAFYVVAVVAIVLTGVSKSGFGGGLGVMGRSVDVALCDTSVRSCGHDAHLAGHGPVGCLALPRYLG